MKTLLLLLLLIIFTSSPIPAVYAEEPPLEEDVQKMIEVLGCMGCHTINDSGGSLAINLTLIGSWKSEDQIKAQLTADPADRKGFMPSYQSLPEKNLRQISTYLYNLEVVSD